MQAKNFDDGHAIHIEDLGQFNELILIDPANWVDLILQEAKEPALRILGPMEMTSRYRYHVRDGRLHLSLGGGLFDQIVDALTTSLTRKHVRIELDVEDLKSVRVKGMVEIDRSKLSTIRPTVDYFGPAAGWHRPFPIR